MGKVILRIQSTESTIDQDELTVERLLAEARAVGLSEFAVMRNGEEVANPDNLQVEDGDLFVILPADYADVEIDVEVANDDFGDDKDEALNEPD